MSVSAGTHLGDRYLLLDRIGSGGMGAVWRATDTVLDRPVAIKVLAAQLSDDPEFRTRFLREARAAARLDHSSITQVYDYGEIDESGGVVQYLVMELLPGQTLAERLGHGPLPWTTVAAIGARVADALAAAHRSGVVHRDITPGNIMLTPTGVKVLDFGISTVAGDSSMTTVGQTLGTPAYLAPERVQGLPATPAVDVYALGAVLFNAATGRTPYQGTWSEQAHAHLHQPAPDTGELPGPLGEILRACLDKRPTERPTAEELADALHRLSDSVAPARVVPPPMAPVPGAAAYPSGSTHVLAATPQPAGRSGGGGTVNRFLVWLLALILFATGVLIAFELASSPDGTNGNADGQTTSASTSSTPTTSTPPTEPATVGELIDRLRNLIGTATLDQQISRRTSVDLGRSLIRVGNRLAEREYREAHNQLEDLRDRVDDRFQAEDIDPSVYVELTELIDELIALVPEENPDQD